MLPFDKDGKVNKNAWVAPFWCVASTKDASKVNMEFSWVGVAIAGDTIMVPHMVNCKDIKPGVELLRLDGASVEPTELTSKKRKSRD